MRNKLLWVDLAVCSLWALAILGCRHYWNTPIQFMAIFAAVMRLSFTFTMVRDEKRAWVPLTWMMGLGLLLAQTELSFGIHTLTLYPFYILDIKVDNMGRIIIGVFFTVWIWAMPVTLYLVRLFRKKLSHTGMKWTEVMGCVLWRDRRAKTYSALMLVCIATMYCGLAMDARVCRIACLSAPALSFWLIVRYYGMTTDKLWAMVAAMVLFFYAQSFGGLWRMVLLAASFALVVYMGCGLYRHTQRHLLSVLTVLYIGVLLPSLAIGYNPYACINYGRYGFYTHQPYNGIFYIKDGDRIGLRDRYGLLVKPEYEHIRHHGRGLWFDFVELQKDGYVALYDILNTRYEKCNDIDGELQENVCRTLRNFTQEHGLKYDDRVEVKVTEVPTEKVLSHVKATVNGGLIYNYTEDFLLPNDTAVLQSGEIKYDTLVESDHPYKAMSHVKDILKDSIAIYRIYIRLAMKTMPEKTMAMELAEEIVRNEILNDRK